MFRLGVEMQVLCAATSCEDQSNQSRHGGEREAAPSSPPPLPHPHSPSLGGGQVDRCLVRKKRRRKTIREEGERREGWGAGCI